MNDSHQLAEIPLLQFLDLKFGPYSAQGWVGRQLVALISFSWLVASVGHEAWMKAPVVCVALALGIVLPLQLQGCEPEARDDGTSTTSTTVTATVTATTTTTTMSATTTTVNSTTTLTTVTLTSTTSTQTETVTTSLPNTTTTRSTITSTLTSSTTATVSTFTTSLTSTTSTTFTTSVTRTTSTTFTTSSTSTTTTTPTRMCELVYLNKNPFGPQNFSCHDLGMSFIQPFPHTVDAPEACCELRTTPSCRCTPTYSPDRSDRVTQCETGFGNSCVNPDMDSKADCLENETLCVAIPDCKFRPGAESQNLEDATCNYPTQNECEQNLHCLYEPSSLTFRLSCESKMESAVWKSECGALSSKDACRRQAVCSWVFFEVTQVCENNGTIAGCVPLGGDLQGLKDHCGLYKTQTACATESDLCTWEGQCRCPSQFWGEWCEKLRVQFSNSHGMCAEKQAEQANSAVCKGLAIAATAEDWQFCNAEQDCTTWNQVKKVVITIYEAELGDFIADGLGLVGAWMCILLLWGPCKEKKRFSKCLGQKSFKRVSFRTRSIVCHGCCIQKLQVNLCVKVVFLELLVHGVLLRPCS